VLRKSLLVVLIALTGVLLNDAVASARAGYAQLCMAASISDGGTVQIEAASTTTLAATGTGLDVMAWVFAGIAIVIVGLALTLLPSRREVGAGTSAGESLPA